MTLKESASKMKNALKLFRPHLPPCSITRAFSLVRQHGDKEPHLSGEISFFPFFFYSVKTVALRWKKMGPREMRKHRKPPEKSLTVRFNHATQRAFNYGKSR